MNVRVCDVHSTILCTATSSSSSSSSSPYHLLLRNYNPSPQRFRGKCSLVSVAEAPAQTLTESVSRRLILLRHAESSWENRSLRDHDRPLSKSGRVDAEKISRKLQQLGWIPELILCRLGFILWLSLMWQLALNWFYCFKGELCYLNIPLDINKGHISDDKKSDAARTKETLKIMQEQVQELLEAEIRFVSSFYSIAAMDGQTAEHLQKVICRYSRDEILTVMCMGHNRGWEEAASMFSGASIELKTCNAALLEASGKSWDEAFAAAGFGGWKLQGIVKPSS